MDFTIYGPEGFEPFTGEANFHFAAETGLLTVNTADGTRRVYSPSGWSYVERAQSDSEAPVVEITRL